MTLHCKKCGEDRDETEFNKHNGRTRGRQYWCKPCMVISSRDQYHGLDKVGRAHKLFRNRRAEARRLGIPFTITLEDLHFPDRCPVLGIPLEFSNIGQRDTSPSIDKIVPSLGYVPGNVIVVSFRANSIKRDATTDELQAVASFYANLSTTGNIQTPKM